MNLLICMILWGFLGQVNSTPFLGVTSGHLPEKEAMSSSNCYFLTCIQISQEAGKVVWYPHLLKNFSRRGYWSELPFPPPGDLPHRGIKPTLFCLLHWQGGSLPLMPPGLMILKFWLCSSICWLNLWSEYTLLVSVKKWLLRLSIHTEERHRSDVNFPSPSVGCNYFMWTKLTLVV